MHPWPGCLGLVLPHRLASCLAPKLIETGEQIFKELFETFKVQSDPKGFKAQRSWIVYWERVCRKVRRMMSWASGPPSFASFTPIALFTSCFHRLQGIQRSKIFNVKESPPANTGRDSMAQVVTSASQILNVQSKNLVQWKKIEQKQKNAKKKLSSLLPTRRGLQQSTTLAPKRWRELRDEKMQKGPKKWT